MNQDPKPVPPIRTVDPDGQVHTHQFDVKARIDADDLAPLRPRPWPGVLATLVGCALIASVLLCALGGGLPFGWVHWPDVRLPHLAWDDVPAATPTTSVVDTDDPHYLNCPPENFHTSDGAYYFSTLPSDSVVGRDKFIVWGLNGRPECTTLGSDSERTGAQVDGKHCLVDGKDDKGQAVKLVATNQRIVYTCVDSRGTPVLREEVTQDLRTRRHDIAGHPTVSARCVVGITDYGCQPKTAVARNP